MTKEYALLTYLDLNRSRLHDELATIRAGGKEPRAVIVPNFYTVLPGTKWCGIPVEGAVIEQIDMPYITPRPHASDAPQEPATDWAQERTDVLVRFMTELAKATGDGSKKRQSGEKPPWYEDQSHEGAIFSHITKWKRGELVDPDSGAHPLVHAAWRCLAIACRESGNIPKGNAA